MKQQRIALIGADGFIGTSMYAYMKEHMNRFQIHGTCFLEQNQSLHYLDMRTQGSLETLLGQCFDFVILIAGTKDVKRCESDYDYAFELNTKPIQRIIKTVSEEGLHTKVIYFSSDYVFEGKTGGYQDTDSPNPNTNYGKTKHLAEQALLASSMDYRIIRTSAVMGKGSLFLNWITKGLRIPGDLSLFSNTYFSPTPQEFLNMMVAACVLEYDQAPPILHIVGEKSFSRYEFGGFLAERIGGVKARLVPDEADLSSSTFQADLTLKQSEFVRERQSLTFEDHMKSELNRD